MIIRISFLYYFFGVLLRHRSDSFIFFYLLTAAHNVSILPCTIVYDRFMFIQKCVGHIKVPKKIFQVVCEFSLCDALDHSRQEGPSISGIQKLRTCEENNKAIREFTITRKASCQRKSEAYQVQPIWDRLETISVRRIL